MSSNNHRTRRAAAANKKNENDATSSFVADATSHKNGRSLRATERKTYCVDSDDEDSKDIEEIKPPAVSPGKRNQQNGFASASIANGKKKLNLENVAKLESITSLSRAESIELLEACDHSLEKAIEIHFGGGISQSTSTGSSKRSSQSKTNNKNNNDNTKLTNKRTHKEIENDAISISDDSNSQSSYSNTNTNLNDNEDYVRAPIAPTVERLVDYDPYGKF
jgi:hypothetical protein